jgi:hypothetical protein
MSELAASIFLSVCVICYTAYRMYDLRLQYPSRWDPGDTGDIINEIRENDQ